MSRREIKDVRDLSMERLRAVFGLKGATWYAPGGKWAAKIRKDRKLLHLGYFSTAQEAHEAYLEAATRLFGPYSRAA